MTMSKSPRRVLQVAYDAACQAVPAHRHRFSPKKFTQPQLLACLVLKEFLRLDYRGLAEHLADHGELTRLLALEMIPHYTTFQKAAARLLKAAPARALFDAVLDRALRAKVRKRRVPLAAVDGTGMESRHTSRYYVKRRSRTGSETQETTYSKYPKVVLVTDCQSHLVLAAVPGRGPGSDLQQFEAAIKDAAGRARIGTLLADADYDAEWVHEQARKTYGIRTIIPPERGRPSEKPPVGRWRRWMRQQFGRFKAKYGQRWQTETVNSMIKRRLGSALRARTYWSQCREIILRVITHNVMIVASA
jgi:Transposase DDE domain